MRAAFGLLLILAFATPVAFMGCDRTASTEQTHESVENNGNVSKTTKTVKQNLDTGKTTVTKEKTQSSQ